MVKISVLYPYQEGARFDYAYYCDKHMPMVAGLMGDVCKGYGIEQGLAGGAPGTPPPYLCIGHLLFESVAAFQGAFPPHAKAIMADIPNYTDVKPLIQVSEVLVG